MGFSRSCRDAERKHQTRQRAPQAPCSRSRHRTCLQAAHPRSFRSGAQVNYVFGFHRLRAHALPANVQRLLNRPKPFRSQAQLLSRLKSGSPAPYAIRPVGTKAAAGGRSQQLFVKRWAPRRTLSHSRIRPTLVRTTGSQQAVILRTRLSQRGTRVNRVCSRRGIIGRFVPFAELWFRPLRHVVCKSRQSRSPPHPQNETGSGSEPDLRNEGPYRQQAHVPLSL